jgi:predicted transcriptional regulator
MKIKIIAPKLAPVNKVLTGDDIQKVISAQASQPITIVFNTSQKPVGIITPSDVLRYVKKFRTS